MKLKETIGSALEKSISYPQYSELLSAYAREGKTSGTHSEDLVHYTKLNAQRSKRIGKTLQLKEDLVNLVKGLSKQTWLVITETWCGDAANSVPVIAAIADQNPLIDLRLVFRDEHPELIDQFLTKGGRSIPKLIALDDDLNVLFDWGPRPEELQKIYWDWREKEDRVPYKEFHLTIQKWYNENKSSSIQQELVDRIAAIGTPV